MGQLGTVRNSKDRRNEQRRASERARMTDDRDRTQVWRND